ncbi:porin [Methylocaldum sp. 14B]|uniref:porin n=1 Tax=unclassified Methylocaldum TaxID=2622260 RepID=UPI00098A7D87|nr:porin [Methylocaldum sp. 14B]
MYKNSSKIRMGRVALGVLAAVFAASVGAEEASEPTGLLGYMGADVNDTQFMKNLGLQFGGWINAGITYNANEPAGRFNGPVTFNDRASEFQLNQLYFYLQRAVNTEGDSWDFGGRFDFMFGTDAQFTQAYGSPRGHWDLRLMNEERFYDIALPQAYFEIFAPFGNGITAKIGHFYTIIGNEVVTAPDNFFYSHAYTMQFGEPFTHTGVLLSYPIDQNWTITAGGVTGSETAGWDGAWDKGLGNWAFLGGVTWASDDKGSSVAFSATSGEISEQDANNWSMYSLVIKHDIMEGLHYTFQHDHGWANSVVGATDRSGSNGTDAEWYGINQYLTYDISDDLAVGLRAEWFRDDDGFRVVSPARTLGALPASSYYAFTAGLNWKPVNWLMVRPNVRYDWADKADAYDNAGGAASFAGKKSDQFLFSADVVITF